jgi:hypothetical protein
MSPGDDGSGIGDRRPRQGGGMRAARRAAAQVTRLTGHEPENVVSIDRAGGEWHVGVEVMELHRVPDTTDVMAVYDVTLSRDGELISCKRGPRYHRGSAADSYENHEAGR